MQLLSWSQNLTKSNSREDETMSIGKVFRYQVLRWQSSPDSGRGTHMLLPLGVCWVQEWTGETRRFVKLAFCQTPYNKIFTKTESQHLCKESFLAVGCTYAEWSDWYFASALRCGIYSGRVRDMKGREITVNFSHRLICTLLNKRHWFDQK